jgi:acetyl-CoA C-acetyltransferase
MYSLTTAYMQVLTGLFDIVAVEAHSKVSDIVNIAPIYDLALDPIYTRPLGLNANFIAGLEMNRYLHTSGATFQDCRKVVEKNRKNALSNELAIESANFESKRGSSDSISYPLTRDDVAPLADGAAVVVLAADDAARSVREDPVWVKGVGWASDSPTLETRDWDRATYAELASKQAYRQAQIHDPVREIQFAEVDDTYSYKELQHTEALGLTTQSSVHEMLDQGVFDLGGKLPVNPSGGSLGMGHTLEMSGLVRVVELVKQLRGDAGKHQVHDVQAGVALAWRGVPTASGAVVVLANR